MPWSRRPLARDAVVESLSWPVYTFIVPIKLEQIVEETRQLPADVVAELVDRILLERHGGMEPEIEAAWKSEIDRRIEEIDSGKVEGIPVDQSLARIRKIAGL